MNGPIADEAFRHHVLKEQPQFSGAVWSVWSETVEIGDQVVVRDVLRHPGAVAVVAIDEQGRVLLIRQYRHPVGAYLWEIPAGLLDVAGEDPLDCAHRELLEEAGVRAERLEEILHLRLSPGGTSERIRIFQAQGLSIEPGGRPNTGEAEEADLPQAWLPLAQAVQLCLDGAITNATAVAAILAVAARSDRARVA
jgi:8-oxo-dGDP phosphatase